MSLIKQVVLPALEEAWTPCYRRLDLDEPDTVVVPIELAFWAHSIALARIVAQNDAKQLRIQAVICWVPKHRRAQVTSLLNQLNCKWPFLTWVLDKHFVQVRTDVDLAWGGNLHDACVHALLRFKKAVREEWDSVVKTASTRRRCSLPDQGLAQSPRATAG